MGGRMTVQLRHPPALTAPTSTAPVLLAMPDQDLHHPFNDPHAPGGRNTRSVTALRLFLFAVPLAITGTIVWSYFEWFTLNGTLSIPAALLTVLTAFTFFWVALSVGTAIIGLVQPDTANHTTRGAGKGLNIAILLPVYGEPAQATIGTAAKLLKSLFGQDHPHRFSLHVLSDSRSPDARAAEAQVIDHVQALYPHLYISYRWRPENTDYKSGNLREWITTKGAPYDALLILDADSVMDAATVLTLADDMAADPAVGLLQTVPRLLPGRTLWQRLQEFSNQVYGVTLARGFASWAGTEANFLGHNALLRTCAFAACAGLPKLPGRRPMGGVILSHDFVEAALIRRAGWTVRMLTAPVGSFEDTPETTVGYIRRDRRWCQGNMQHLRIMFAAGLHPVSRFHMMQGAMAYLASLTWAALLVLWVVVGDNSTPSPFRYFTMDNPLLPIWPEMPLLSQAMLAGTILLTLLVPKMIGAIDYVRRNGLDWGQVLPFTLSMWAELVISILCAPMMMVQHVRAVVRTFAGFDTGWIPHTNGTPRLIDLLRFHAVETTLGAAMIAAAIAGWLSLWLMPIAVCLLVAAPVARFLAQDAQAWPLFRFDRRVVTRKPNPQSATTAPEAAR
jgi:membrane glycosyltransferase